MGVKLGLVIPLTFLILLSSLIKDVEPKPRAARALRFNPIKEGRRIVTALNDLTTLVLGLDGIIKFVKADKSDAEFQGNVTRKLDDMLRKIDNLDGKIVNLRAAIGSERVELLDALAGEFDREPMKKFLDRLSYINEEFEDNFAEIRDRADRYGYDVVEKYIAPIEHNKDLINNLRKIVTDVKPRGFQKSIFQMVIDHSTAQVFMIYFS